MDLKKAKEHIIKLMGAAELIIGDECLWFVQLYLGKSPQVGI